MPTETDEYERRYERAVDDLEVAADLLGLDITDILDELQRLLNCVKYPMGLPKDVD